MNTDYAKLMKHIVTQRVRVRRINDEKEFRKMQKRAFVSTPRLVKS